MIKDYYYFATHVTNESICKWIKSGVEYKTLTQTEKDLLDQLVKSYKERDKNKRFLEYCSEFINNNSSNFKKLKKSKGSYALKFFLRDYLGYHFKWQSSMKSFSKRDGIKADKINESDLIEEIIDNKSTIKKLLDAAEGDLKLVKPFLPAIMISLQTNTRDRSEMEFKHTGRFCFDFDKIGDENTTLKWLNKVWKGTTHVKPYLAFISPSGNDFKIFCQVDTSSEDFKNNFLAEIREEVMSKHKIWYQGAIKELTTHFPEIAKHINTATNDPQRLTFLPFIVNKNTHFKYRSKIISDYSNIINKEKELRRIDKEKTLKKHATEVKSLMKKEGITSKGDALILFQKNRSKSFDLEFEVDKFKKVITFIVDLSKKDARVKQWLRDNFSSYEILNKQSWVLYGVFGSIAIEELKKLIRVGSDKLDELHGDYRWTNKND